MRTGDVPDASKQGAGPHDFMLTVTADGSEDWEPRNTQFSVEFGGEYEAEFSGLWLDGTWTDAASNGPEFTVTAGETSSVNVWHNVSEPAQTVTDPNDVQANPCANAANPCAQDRTVLVYQNTYTYRGVIKGDPGADGANSVNTFSITTMLSGFELYAPSEGAAGGVVQVAAKKTTQSS